MAHTFRNTDESDRRSRARSDREFRRTRRGQRVINDTLEQDSGIR